MFLKRSQTENALLVFRLKRLSFCCAHNLCAKGTNAIKLIENALKEARQGAFRVRNCHDFEKMCMPNRRRGTPPEKL